MVCEEREAWRGIGRQCGGEIGGKHTRERVQENRHSGRREETIKSGMMGVGEGDPGSRENTENRNPNCRNQGYLITGHNSRVRRGKTSKAKDQEFKGQYRLPEGCPRTAACCLQVRGSSGGKKFHQGSVGSRGILLGKKKNSRKRNLRGYSGH